jgi:hypothetical protein
MATDPTQYAGEGSIYSVTSTLKSSYQYQYSLQAQKDWRSNIVTVGYVGNMGRHIANFGPGNQAVDSTKYNPASNFGVPFSDLSNYTCNNPTENCTVNSPDITAVSTVSLSTFTSNDVSDYNALQASFLRRSTSGLTTSINYTYSHLMNNASLVGEGAGLNPLCTMYGCRVDTGNGGVKVEGQSQYDWGNGDLDLRHRVTGVLTYQMPFAKNSHGILNAVAGGWTANLMGTLQTGMHYTATAQSAGPGGGGGGSLSQGEYVYQNNYSSCNDPWTLNKLQAAAAAQGPNTPVPVNTPWCPTTWTGLAADARPNMICDPNKSNKGGWKRSINEYFNPNCLVLQTLGTYGDERRNQLVAPGMKRADISMIKQFSIAENYKLQLRMEGFNITNTPSYGTPSYSTGCTNFDPSSASTCTNQTLAADLTTSGATTLPVLSNPSSCISQRTSTTASAGPPGSGAVACITTVQGINRQFQFALKLTF